MARGRRTSKTGGAGDDVELRRRSVAEARWDLRGNRCSLTAVAGFGLLFAGLVAFWGCTAYEVYRLRTCYAETTGRVLASELSEARSGKRTTYSATFRYAYEVAGKAYQGDRYGAVLSGSGDAEFWRAAVASHPVDSMATVYYDPDHPQRSVLTRDLSACDIGFIAFVPLFILLLVFFVLRGMRDKDYTFAEWYHGFFHGVAFAHPLILPPIGIGAVAGGVCVALFAGGKLAAAGHPMASSLPWIFGAGLAFIGVGLAGMGVVRWVQERRGWRKRGR